MLEFAEYLKITLGLLAILNPLGVVPVFISMTTDQNKQQLRRTINLVALSVAFLLLTSLFFGDAILAFFGISIDSFRVGGGILILLMAVSMLQGKQSSVKQTAEEADESIEKESVAVVPLAMPLLVGPGAISTVILAAHKSQTASHYSLIAFGIVLVSCIVWLTFRLSPWISKHISATGINVGTRIMGLILAAIAVEFIANGLKGLFPVLA